MVSLSCRSCSSAPGCVRSPIGFWLSTVPKRTRSSVLWRATGFRQRRSAPSWPHRSTGNTGSPRPTMCSTIPGRPTPSNHRWKRWIVATADSRRNPARLPDVYQGRLAALHITDGAQCRHRVRRSNDVIRYEHPLNERIRTLMRLEDLYTRALFFTGETTPADHHAALTALFEIVDVAARADLKTDILQELERQRQLLAPLRHNPAIEAAALNDLLSEIDAAAGKLLAQTGKVGQQLRDNEWLMAIKQRTGIPGGACEFDLPAYHHWLNVEPVARQRDLQTWLAPLLPILAGLSIILRLLRDNG